MTDHLTPVTGGCLCGAVRYASGTPPVMGAYCHCFGPAFRITGGELKHFQSSSFARRGFCAECGSGLTFSYEGDADVWVTLGSLDHPEDWPMTTGATWGPSKHVEIGTRIPWYAIGDGLPQTPTVAPALVQAAKDHVARTRGSA